MKNKLSKSSLLFSLTLLTLLVFIGMLIFSNFMLAKGQEKIASSLMEDLTGQINQMQEAKSGKALTLVIDEAGIRSMSHFRLYTVFVMLFTMIGGGGIIVYFLRKMLKPLEELREKVNEIDIEKVGRIKDRLVDDKAGHEILDLARAFEKALNKIYYSYEKEKRFSANTAHELKTPLAIMKSRLDVFKQKNSDLLIEDRINKLMVSLDSNLDRLSDLVDGILFLANDGELEIRETSLWDLVEEIILDLEEKAADHGISLQLAGDRAQIKSDDRLLERALYNLIDNAIKYNKAGGYCKVIIEERTEEISVKVADSGPGMSQAEKGRAFDLFYRADESRQGKYDKEGKRETQGFGIGLTLVKEIVVKLGGKIAVKDNYPCGSLFEITFEK